MTITVVQTSNKSAGMPPIPDSARRETTLFDSAPLSADEASEFIECWSTGETTMDSTLRALSAKTQAMLWLAHDRGVLNDSSVLMLIISARDDLIFGCWDQTADGYQTADNVIQSTLLVADAISDSCVLDKTDRNAWIFHVRQAVFGFAYRGEGVVSSPPVFGAADEIAPVAGVAAFIIGARHYATEDSVNLRLVAREYVDKEERMFIGNGIGNPVLEAYVMKHPESGYGLGRFAAERDLGTTVEDAQNAFAYLAETSDTKSVREGWL